MKAHTLYALICFSLLTPSLFGQTNAPADTNSIAANPVPVSQASDDVIKKLSSLVHDGKYAEAQQLASGLLLAYPDDQRLIKAKTLLDKLIATSNGSQPTNTIAQPAASGTSDQLTGMEKVEYNSLIELGREAQQTTDLDQQKILLHRFMDESKPFLEKHPNDLLLWQLRAASALSLDDMLAGYEAGQKLLTSGMADNDPTMQRLLSQLNLKGWLDKQKVEDSEKYGWILGTWNISMDLQPLRNITNRKMVYVLEGARIIVNSKQYFNVVRNGYLQHKNLDMRMEIISRSGTNVVGYRAGGTSENNTEYDLQGTLLDDGKITWEYNFPSKNADGGSLYPSGWVTAISCVIADDKNTMTVSFPTASTSKESEMDSEKNPMVFILKKISGSQGQSQQSMQAPQPPPAEPRP
jgi:hypothetical protein